MLRQYNVVILETPAQELEPSVPWESTVKKVLGHLPRPRGTSDRGFDEGKTLGEAN